jgi:hypothetical protein
LELVFSISQTPQVTYCDDLSLHSKTAPLVCPGEILF